MSGALLGIKARGETKLMRLHGERSVEAVLEKALAWAKGQGGPGEAAGFPPLPRADLDACGDVAWGFVNDLDTGELRIYINRHARFAWRELAMPAGAPVVAVCSVPLAHVQRLLTTDASALQGLLLRNFFSDGIDPVLPLRSGAPVLSDPFSGPGDWQARLQLAGGRARLLLQRGDLRATLRQASDLQLDDPHCGALLHAALEPRALAMTLAIHGPAATLGQAARVAAALPQMPFAPGAGGLPLLALALQPDAGLDLPPGPDYFDRVRARFLAAGMSLQGWRFLMRQDDAVLRFVLQFFPPSAAILRGFARFVDLLASALQSERLGIARCQAALRGVERILDRTRGRPGELREENARIFLRAIVRARLAPEDEANLVHESQDVSDFVYEHRGVLAGATWASLRRRSDDWHRALLIAVDPARDVRWPALLPRFDAGAYHAVELGSGCALAEDGLEQRHCIGSYANACASGGTRVFSLRQASKDGHGFKRVATLELQRGHDGAWRLVQIRGKANTPVRDAAVLAAADQVVAAYAMAAASREREAALPLRERPQPEHYSPPAYLVHRQDHWTG